MYTKKMYKKCIPQFNKLLYTFCIQNLAAIVSSFNFVYKMFIKVCRNVEYSLYTKCIHDFCVGCYVHTEAACIAMNE